MRSLAIVSVPLRIADTILDEIQEMYDQITKRAYEVFLKCGGASTSTKRKPAMPADVSG